MGFDRIINVPSRKIGQKTVETLLTYARNYDLSIPEIIQNIEEIDEFGSAAKRALSEFGKMYADMSEFLATHTIDESIGYIVKRIGYEAFLTAEYGEEDGATKMENVNELQNMASRYNSLEPAQGVQMFLEDIALLSEADKIETNADYISLMTVHLSKGLEFEKVMIVGAEE